jgi:hypothetical protein
MKTVNLKGVSQNAPVKAAKNASFSPHKRIWKESHKLIGVPRLQPEF